MTAYQSKFLPANPADAPPAFSQQIPISTVGVVVGQVRPAKSQAPLT